MKILSVVVSVAILLQAFDTSAFCLNARLVVSSSSLSHKPRTRPSTYDFSFASTKFTSVSATKAERSQSFGVIESFANVFEKVIDKSHDVFSFFGVENSYALSIILFTLLSKLATLPLIVQQLEVSTKTEKLKPLEEKIKEKYRHDEETKNLLLTQLSKSAKINQYARLAAMLIELPITLAMQRAMHNLVRDQKLSQSFLWIPNLRTPAWDQWLHDPVNIDSAVKIGEVGIKWSRSIAYFSLPLLYLFTRWISTKLLNIVTNKTATIREYERKVQGKEEEFAQKLDWLMAVMMVYSALRLPSAIILYYLFNTIFTTALTILVNNQIKDRALPEEVTQLMDFVDELVVDRDSTITKQGSLLNSSSAGSSATRQKEERKESVDVGVGFIRTESSDS